MAINFPAFPDFDQVFFDENSGNSYIWDGYAWVGYSTTPFTVTFSANSFEVSNDDVLLGPSTALNFGFGLGVERGPGISTITNLYPTQWAETGAGIHTLSNVGIGTTNPGEKLQVDGNIRVGVSTTSNYITFYGTYKDGPSNVGGELPYQHTYIGERIYDYSGSEAERSELLLFKGNDTAGVAGPDRIRLLAGEHRFDVIGFNTTGTFEQVGVSTAAVNKLTITSTGVGIGTTNPTSALTVKGNTSLETLNVSGVSTLTTTDFTGHITLKAVSGNSSLYVLDNNIINVGSGNDLTISHSSIDSVSRIREDGGNLEISANPIELQHSDSTKLETIGAGVTVTGTTFTNQLSVSGVSTFNNNVYFGNDDTLVFGDTPHFTIRSFGGNDSIIEHTNASNGDLYLLSKRGVFIRTADGEASGYFRANGAVELYYDNSKKFETLGTGVTITGTTFTDQLSVSGVSTFGSSVNFGSALGIGTNSSESLIQSTSPSQFLIRNSVGPINLRSNEINLISDPVGSPEYLLRGFGDGSVELYYDNSKKFETLGAGVTVTGTTFTNQLNVSGVSTFNNNVRVAGIVTANSVLISNDGGNNGSVLIEDVGAYSQISFRASNGTTQTQIQGVESSLYITPGSGGYIGLSGSTTNIFYGTGDVVLNNGLQGTTHAANGLRVTGLTSTTSFNVGTAITATATSGIVTATGGFSSGIGTGVQITTVGDQLIFTVPGVGSTSLTLYP